MLVTGAEHATGRAAVRGLLRAGGEVRAYVDPAAAPEGLVQRLRVLGCKTARGALDDEGHLELAMEQAHTVLHAAAEPLTDADELLDAAASVLSAALGAGCRRLIFLSHLGADEPRGNRWLEACAEAEGMLADAPLETVVLRRALTYGTDDALTGVLATTTAGASPDALHAPLWIDDLVAALVAADARDRATPLPHLLVSLAGPEATSLGEFVALLGGQVSDEAAAAVGSGAPPLPGHVVELLSRDLLPAAGAPTAGTSPRSGAAVVREHLRG